MYKFIVAYLIGILVEVFFNTDLYFVLMSFIMSFIILIFFKSYKLQGDSDKFKKLLTSFILCAALFFAFSVAVFYTKESMKLVSYKDLGQNVFDFSGQVVDMKQSSNNKQVTIEAKHATDLSNNSVVLDFPKYINVSVSPYSHFELYDNLEIVGTVEFSNYQITYTDEPLFFSYQQEKLFYNTPYNVSQPKNISQIVSTKNFREKAVILFYDFGETLKSKISDHMSEPYAGIASGISLGDQDTILKDTKDIFKKSGLIHILVLSGANVSFMVSLLWYLLRKTKNNFRIICAIFTAWLFIFFTGLTPPSVRAGVMSSTNILAEFFGKNISAIQSLLFSIFILTILNPLSLVFSPSMQLSFLACFGLFIIAEKLEIFFKNKFLFFKKFKFINFLLSTFLGIFLTTTPYILALNGASSLLGTVLTFLVEPVVWLIMISSFIIILVSFLNFYVADFFGILNTLCTKIILHTAGFGANYLPQINLQIPKIYLIIYYLVLGIIFLTPNQIYQKEKILEQNSKMV